MGARMVDGNLFPQSFPKPRRVYLADGVLALFCPLTGFVDTGRRPGLKVRSPYLWGRLLDSTEWRMFALPLYEAVLPYVSSRRVRTAYGETLWQAFRGRVLRGRALRKETVRRSQERLLKVVRSWGRTLDNRFVADEWYFDGP